MKYLFAILMASLLSACTKVVHIEVTGTTPGINDGSFVIKNVNDSTIKKGDIVNGKFDATQTIISPGYYSINISRGTEGNTYQLYLEEGKYAITTNQQSPANYPAIVSSSKTQNELSAYYALADKIAGEVHGEVTSLKNRVITGPQARSLPAKELAALTDKFKLLQAKEAKLTLQVITEYLDKNPQSTIVAHMMSAADYENNPLAFYKLYQKFSDGEKNSAEGKELGTKLNRLVKLSPGQVAPEIVGTTPDGKPVDLKAMHKKLILIEFWRVDKGLSHLNHQDMVETPAPEFKNKKLGIISVSFDTERDVWLKAIKSEKLSWTQVSDLKGDDSPNALNWGITAVPAYVLLDGEGRIIEYNISYTNITFYIRNYLQQHP